METKGILNIETKTNLNGERLELIIDSAKLDCSMMDLVPITSKAVELILKGYKGMGYTKEQAKEQLLKLIKEL